VPQASCLWRAKAFRSGGLARGHASHIASADATYVASVSQVTSSSLHARFGLLARGCCVRTVPFQLPRNRGNTGPAVKGGVGREKEFILTSLKKTRGFTLIELIVVIVIIGILAAIAAVAYTQFISNAEATSVETGADQIVRAINAEQVFTQRPVSLAADATGAFAAGTLQVWDKNATPQAYANASDELVTDLNSAVNNNTLTVDSTTAGSANTAGTGTIKLSDGSYECTIQIPLNPAQPKVCGDV
jgi:prepilin-type N-terminal cleavage/methylation domain-containing protein